MDHYNMQSVNRKAPFQCPMCPKQYTIKYVLKAHMNVSHDKVKRYECYFCSFAFFTESQIIKHISNHTKEKPYNSQYLFQWYRKENSVKRHKDGNSCNRKLTLPLLSHCYFCGKVFSTHRNLKGHMKKVHLKEGFKGCNLCSKYFASTSATNHHISSVHLRERNYKCQLCSKRFGYNSELNRHIRSVHTKEKHFKCYFCSKSFVDFEALKLHTWIHTTEKPLTCYFCWKDFSIVRDLLIHIGRIHTKERPFKCMQCPSRCYSSKGDLNQHTRIKHGIRFINE
jgi:KRAB domain-containing zinc finger protein